MNYYLEKISPEEWSKLSSAAHKISFSHERSPDVDRIDYALLVRNDSELCCYATIIELDKDSVYMQHGGSFPNAAKGVVSVKGYFMFTNWLKEHYQTISTRIFNKNHPMLKLALAADLDPVGMDVMNGMVFLNCLWERPKKMDHENG